MSAACIRMGSLRLCLALMFGLLVVSGYVVAPVLFAEAGSRMLAGHLAGSVFHLANRGFLFLAAAVIVFWLRMGRDGALAGRLRWALLLVAAALIAGNAFAVAPVIADLKAQMGVIDELAADDPQRHAFGLWHGVSAIVHLLATLATALLVALGPIQRERSAQA